MRTHRPHHLAFAWRCDWAGDDFGFGWCSDRCSLRAAPLEGNLRLTAEEYGVTPGSHCGPVEDRHLGRAEQLKGFQRKPAPLHEASESPFGGSHSRSPAVCPYCLSSPLPASCSAAPTGKPLRASLVPGAVPDGAALWWERERALRIPDTEQCVQRLSGVPVVPGGRFRIVRYGCAPTGVRRQPDGRPSGSSPELPLAQRAHPYSPRSLHAWSRPPTVGAWRGKVDYCRYALHCCPASQSPLPTDGPCAAWAALTGHLAAHGVGIWETL